MDGTAVAEAGAVAALVAAMSELADAIESMSSPVRDRPARERIARVRAQLAEVTRISPG